MAKELFSKIFDEIKGYHFVFAFLFLAAFGFRIYASQSIQINSYEASILLKITDRVTSYPDGISIIESLLIKSSFFIFGENDLGARIWPIIIGSLMVLWPLFLTNRFSINSAIVLSFLIAIDPFMIVNSIQLGSNIFSISACAYLIVALWNQKKYALFLSLLFLLLSGRGLFFSLLLGLIFSVFNIDLVKRKSVELLETIDNYREKITNSKKLNIYFVGIALFFIISFLRIDLSLTISDLIKIFSLFFKEYIPISSIFSNLVILISYQPLLLLLSIIGLITLNKQGRKYYFILFAWVFAVFISMLINTYFKSFDLIWLSFPLSILSAFSFSKYFYQINKKEKSNAIGLIILLICLLSLAANFFTLIYQGVSGFSQNNSFFTLINTIVIMLMFGLYFIYQYSFKKFVYIFTNSFLIIIFIIQIGISFRASGLSGSPYSELLWVGDIVERDQLFKQVDKLYQTKGSSADCITVGLINYSEPSLTWDLRDLEMKELINPEFPKERYDILISANQIMSETPYRYFGQKFIENAYPVWANQPIINLFSADYWSWNTIRRSKMDQSYYFIYVNAENKSLEK